MNNKNTIFLIAASLLIGLFMPFLTKLMVLIIQAPAEVSFIIKTAFTYDVFYRFVVMMGLSNAVPFVLLSILFLDTNRIKARYARQETGKGDRAYRFSLGVTVLCGCYVLASSLYVNIVSLSEGFIISPHLYTVNVVISIIAVLSALAVVNVAARRLARG